MHRPGGQAIRVPSPASAPCLHPALVAAGQVLAQCDQTLMNLTGEQRDAVHTGVLTKSIAGYADLAAAGLEQDTFVEIGRLLLGMRELNRGMIIRQVQLYGPGDNLLDKITGFLISASTPIRSFRRQLITHAVHFCRQSRYQFQQRNSTREWSKPTTSPWNQARGIKTS